VKIDSVIRFVLFNWFRAGQPLPLFPDRHLDVWQIHEVIYHNDPELIYASDGVLEALTKAKQQGKVALRRLRRALAPRDSSGDALPGLCFRYSPDAPQSTGPKLP
jgi:hypothetical protein